MMEEVFALYESQVEGAYNYYVSIKNEKPAQVLIEVENTFVHLVRASAGSNSVENVSKAKNHIVRLSLDVHKLLIIELRDMLMEAKASQDVLSRFISMTKEARDKELHDSVSPNKQDAIDCYCKAINIATNALNLPALK